MPDVVYTIRYVTDNAKALKGIAELDAALVKLMATEQKAAGMLKVLGQNMPGVRQGVGELKKLDAELKNKVVDAGRAAAALAAVGKDNRAVTSLTARLKELEAELKTLAAEAAAAQAALATVGAGVNLPSGGGGRGGAGGKGSGGTGLVAGLARHAAFAAFRTVVRAAGEGSRDRRQFFSGAADMASDYRKDLQPLAVLQGKTSADDSVIAADLAFQKKTLLNPEDAATFRLEFGGAIAPSLKARGKDGRPNITPQVAAELEEKAGRFTARYGLDAQTGGRMAGLLGVTTKVPTADAGIGIMEQAMEQLNVEGVGPVKGMASHLLSLSGTMLEEGGGRFKDYTEMAARLAASTVNQAGRADRAKTRIVQSDRLLQKLAFDDESELGRKAKITSDDDYEAAIRKIGPLLPGNVVEAHKMLADAGYRNSTERLALIEEAKMNGIVDKQLAGVNPAKSTATAVARNAEYPSTIPGKQQAAENEEFAQTVRVGIQGEGLKAARAEARADLINRGELKPKGVGGSLADMFNSQVASMGGVSGEDLRVDAKAVALLRGEGRRVGVDIDKEFPTLDPVRTDGRQGLFSNAGSDEAAFQAEFAAASGRVDAAKALRKAAGALNTAAGALDQADKGGGNTGGGGPAPKTPTPPPVGNGGAGTTPMRR
jgi:hypothetical protein